MVTKQTVADRIAAYLRHDISLAELVSWAEDAVMDGDFAQDETSTIAAVVARLVWLTCARSDWRGRTASNSCGNSASLLVSISWQPEHIAYHRVSHFRRHHRIIFLQLSVLHRSDAQRCLLALGGKECGGAGTIALRAFQIPDFRFQIADCR